VRLKKLDPTEFYVEYLKKSVSSLGKEKQKQEDNPKEEIKKELRKAFEKDRDKTCCLL
jgi:hypothetical protein